MKLPEYDLRKTMFGVIRAAMFVLVVSALYSLYVTWAYKSGDGSLYAAYATVPEQIEGTLAGVAVICGGSCAAEYILSYLGK